MRSSGFTLIELLVVVGLMGVMAGLVLPSMREFQINQAIGNAATELMVDAKMAQAHAIKINKRTVVEPLIPNDWLSGWRIYVDNDANISNSFDSSTGTVISSKESISSSVQQLNISGTPASCDHISFKGDGFLASGNCRVVFGSSVTSRYRFIIVNLVGRVRVCATNAAAGTGCLGSG